jgi:hypothetical protein
VLEKNIRPRNVGAKISREEVKGVWEESSGQRKGGGWRKVVAREM